VAARTWQLSYAGVGLSIGDQANLGDWLARHHYLENLRELNPVPRWPGANKSRLSFPPWPDYPTPQIGRYFYPTHASRYSVGFFLATTTELAAMEAAVFGGGTPVAKPFVCRADDITHTDNSGGISTNLFMLPARPLGQTSKALSGLDGCYLITLVDERYYWQYKTVGIAHTGLLATWPGLLATITSALGVTFSYSAISSVYGSPEPDSDLYTNYEPLPLLLDTVAYNVGLTVVRNLDGTYGLVRTQAGDTTIAANRPPVPRYRAVGGNIMDPQETGNIYENRMNAVLPASVDVTFPKWQYKPTTGYIDTERAGFFVLDSYGDTFVVNVTLVSLGVPYNNFSGFNGIKLIHDTCKAQYPNATGTGNPDNLVQRQQLATQLAKDYYDAQLEGLDETYAGIRKWAPEPSNDIIWSFGVGPAPTHRGYPEGMADGDVLMISTRVMRKPWDFGVDQMHHKFPSLAPPISSGVASFGSGSMGGDCSGAVNTPCCNCVPKTLHLTLMQQGGSMECSWGGPRVITLTYDPNLGYWTGTDVCPPTFGGDQIVTWNLFCGSAQACFNYPQDSDWVLEVFGPTNQNKTLDIGCSTPQGVGPSQSQYTCGINQPFQLNFNPVFEQVNPAQPGGSNNCYCSVQCAACIFTAVVTL